jgi:hypothetical protein
VQPVTIKNKELLVTLVWQQYMLIILLGLAIVMGLVIQYGLLLLIPLLLTGLYFNAKIIKTQQNYHLVLNAQNQWHLVHQNTNQVVEAHLESSWHTPVFIALRLSSSLGPFWYMILRSRSGAQKYSRIIIGLHDE